MVGNRERNSAMKRNVYFWLTIASLMVAFHQPAMADINGSIWGVVRDPSGGTMAGATVALSNPETGLRRRVLTSSNGDYEFVAVPVGRGYMLEVEAAGFKKFSQADIHLVVNERFKVDVDLTVGAVSETEVVSAAPAQVETGSTHIGHLINDRNTPQPPLNAPNLPYLIRL